MRVLLIKTSSMGDLIHTLPALTDAGNAIPGIRFDWMAEEAFAEIPTWHPLVDRVIPIALRRWRKNIFASQTRKEWRDLSAHLKSQQYDLILDAQGLVKSGFLALMANGPRAGLDFRSAREAFASFAYHEKHRVNFHQHAVHRMRSLFSHALRYPMPTTAAIFGLDRGKFHSPLADRSYVVFLHGTTWASKQWPETYWQELARIVTSNGLRVVINGGSEAELERASRIAANNPAVDVVGRVSIKQMADLLSGAKAAVAVDTGFAHLAAALDLPTVSIYGSTNADFTGAVGPKSILLQTQFPCSPCLKRTCTYSEPSTVKPACYTTVPPAMVWETLSKF